MEKKHWLIFAGVSIAVVLIITLTWLFGWGAKNPTPKVNNQNSSQPTVAQVELEENEKPTIELEISNDRSGADLTVSNILEKFSKLEYELIYTAEAQGQEIERGVAGGPLEITGSREVSSDMLFGTESCTTGTCHRRIDKNVSKGTLLVRLITPENQTWSIEQDFDIKESGSGYEAVWTD